MRTATMFLSLALLACSDEVDYQHEPSLSIHGGWQASHAASPAPRWIGTETVRRTTHDGCSGERALTAEAIAAACATCSLTLEITSVDDAAWCDTDAPGLVVGDVLAFDDADGTVLLLDGEELVPYAVGELVGDVLTYEVDAPVPGVDVDPAAPRHLGDETPRP